jgi:hypothetical protein
MGGEVKIVSVAGLDVPRILDRVAKIDHFMRELTAEDEHSLEALIALGAVWKGVKLRQQSSETLQVMEEASDRLAAMYRDYLKERS